MLSCTITVYTLFCSPIKVELFAWIQFAFLLLLISLLFFFFSYKCFVQRIIKEIFAGCLHFICGKKITIKIMLSFWTVKKCRFNLNNHYYDCYFFIVHHLSGYCHAHMRQYGQMWCAISKHKLQVMQRNAFNQNKN